MRPAKRLVFSFLVTWSLVAPQGSAQSVRDVFEQVLQQVVTIPVPDAIAPFVTIAQNADTLAVASLEIYAAQREKRILREMCGANRQREAELKRQWEAIQRMKSTMVRIKRQRAAEERRAKEDGWDPFAGRLIATAPMQIPGLNTFVLLNDGLGEMPGDDPVGPAVSIVTPDHAGSDAFTIPLLDATVTVLFQPSIVAPGSFDVLVQGFRADMAPYDVAPGTSTGPNHAELNPHGSAARGTYDRVAGEFSLQIEGMITNAFYPPQRPILWFANLFGCLDESTGICHVICDDPMIAPLPPQQVPVDQPKLMGAHRLAFDGATRRLHLLENTTNAPGADVAMIRRSDGTYLFDRSMDDVLGAQILVDPLQLIGQPDPGVFAFADTPMRIEAFGGVLATGILVQPTLSLGRGSLVAGWDLQTVTSPSPVLNELASAIDPLLFQIALGPAAYDLLIVTNDFQASGRLEIPETFHLGVPPCQGIVETGGIGCPDRSTVLRMTFDGCPDLGETAILGTSFDPTNLGPQFLTLGLSDTNWLGLPLPLPLDPFGAPGCFVNAEPGMVFPVPNPGGGGSLALPIPPDPLLGGLELHFQGLVIDPLANTLGLATSNRMSVTLK